MRIRSAIPPAVGRGAGGDISHGGAGLYRWSVLVLLAILAAGLLATLGVEAVSAQSRGRAVAVRGRSEGVFAVAGQLSRETYGLYLVDYDNSTICVYQYFPRDRKLRLVVARRYEFDVQLNKPGPGERKTHDR